jgi:hypothetical protein
VLLWSTRRLSFGVRTLGSSHCSGCSAIPPTETRINRTAVAVEACTRVGSLRCAFGGTACESAARWLVREYRTLMEVLRFLQLLIIAF